MDSCISWPIVVIGIGGIGGIVASALAQYHGGRNDNREIILVDGDSFTIENRDRQYFEHLANKATHTAQILSTRYPDLRLRSYDEYVDERNAFLIVPDQHIIFSCVDDHYARKVISLQCDDIDNCILINGGNELLDGASQCSIRHNGVWLTPPLHVLYPHILEAKQSERGRGCGQSPVSREQSFFVNFAIAADMLKFYNYIVSRGPLLDSDVMKSHIPPVNEFFSDLDSLKTRSIMHIPDAYGGSYE